MPLVFSLGLCIILGFKTSVLKFEAPDNIED